MKQIKQLLEAKKSTVVLAFGRLNPPTKGHEVLAMAVQKLAQKYNADHVFYISRTQDSKKNPLNVDQKVHYARQSFKGLNVVGASDKVRTFIEAAKELTGKYDNLVMVAGSDRVLEYKQLLDKYNGKDFNFKSILVVSAGERDPDAEGAAGMSATKMRQAAAENNFAKFKQGVPSSMNAVTAKKMFDDVRSGMRLSEDVDEVREEYINERVFNVGDVVEYADAEFTITFRGSNYVVITNEEVEIKAWLHDIKPTSKVNEAIMIKQQDKLKAARIIGMSLGYMDAETKNDPTMIVNNALRGVRNKALNPEAKHIISRMLELAKQMEIKYDDKLLGLKEEAAVTDDEKEAHNLLHKPGRAQQSSYERIRKIQIKTHESAGAAYDDEEPVDEEELYNSITDDDIIEHGYDDHELQVVDESTGEFIEEFTADMEQLVEVLSKVERMRAKTRMKRTEAKRERAKKIALKRRSSTAVLTKRARRIAVKTLEKRLAKKPLNKLSVAEKERLEARISRMKPLITRLAVRMLPKVRKVETERLTHKSTAKE